MEAVLLYRMREIETQLGMWMQRYIYYLDRTRGYKKAYEIEPGQEVRFANLNEGISRYATTPSRSRVRTLITILALGWILFIARELILTIVS